MVQLENLQRGMRIGGILPHRPVTIIDVQWRGTVAIELTYKDDTGRTDRELLYRSHEPTLEMLDDRQRWRFDADGALFRLASEAHRIKLAYLFDPLLAVHSSLVEPLPHQITAVYGEMLPRQPLRFLLADDPGAGKTIMAGLLIKELLVRGDVHRCLVVCPGSLVEQWQDELNQRFHLPFDILTNDQVEAARSGNWFTEHPLAIARLDKLSRNEDLQHKLEQVDWDLVICDEAHKLSATFFGGEIRYTKRYRLAQRLAHLTRHFLLLTATPHNGKEEDFQLFMALLDADRFEGRFRDGVHVGDTSDLMRRLVKEQLLTFEATPLFPERCAYTVSYTLSDDEAQLYEDVTDYVRTEFNRVDELEQPGRRGTVGFALTALQRRLASSPAAIHQSLQRRRERLQSRVGDERDRHDHATTIDLLADLPLLNDDDLADLDDAPEDEQSATEAQIIDQATAAHTIAELEAEIATLTQLESLALRVRNSGRDRKWEELSRLLQDRAMMFDGHHRRKLVIFTEYRDTLTYLAERIRTLLGRHEAVLIIHGGLRCDERAKVQESFRHDAASSILIATDAAGEGINLQCAHLMVNYDLPWNPNRPLRELLLEAIRYGDRPDVRARLTHVVETALDRHQLRKLVEERALVQDAMDVTRVQEIRADMERAEARRLQPHFIESFFLAAFQRLGGIIHKREANRYEIRHVPAAIRSRQRNSRDPVVQRYQRITFAKNLIHVEGKPPAAFVCPGHPLLDATLDLTLERYDDVFQRGATLIDPQDTRETARVLCYIEHTVQDGHVQRRPVSRQVQFVELDAQGTPQLAGYAPYLDYRPPDEAEQALLKPVVEEWLQQDFDLEQTALNYAIEQLAPAHLSDIQQRKNAYITKTLNAVRDRLTKEITYWDRRANELREQELAGKKPRLNSARARQRADELETRLQQRTQELEQERRLSLQPPMLICAALIVPGGLLARLQGQRTPAPSLFARETRRVEQAAMAAVMAAERRLGHTPRDVSADNCGYDIESRDAHSGRLRFIEVKGRIQGARTVTVTKNEILTALNQPDSWLLALVEVPPADFPAGDAFHTGIAEQRATYHTSNTDDGCVVRYVRRPFQREPDFHTTSVNYAFAELWEKGQEPG
ncbi:MAG: macromolecule metabolism [Chloroflexi bacterium AL-W]|nr:macromolecule metabolism [Chloroflexi bacterium AL-N1]NOK68256.1 macromolecule metabolism [Chloroflexi bacterium AL-N10]NOK73902.1 macromolecule metabolism [Chloroflexi bacterium AL-N5]NOK82870.1 macromolecule metabolism [Chloroflexi bacterium AL-W]NOK90392.1 macromolecule metabolism [Chloroflexi bacterium AL-N15]